MRDVQLRVDILDQITAVNTAAMSVNKKATKKTQFQNGLKGQKQLMQPRLGVNGVSYALENKATFFVWC